MKNQYYPFQQYSDVSLMSYLSSITKGCNIANEVCIGPKHWKTFIKVNFPEPICHFCLLLEHDSFLTISCRWSFSVPPEDMRKLQFCWCFQRVCKELLRITQGVYTWKFKEFFAVTVETDIAFGCDVTCLINEKTFFRAIKSFC